MFLQSIADVDASTWGGALVKSATYDTAG